jgi:arylsulfatase A-like enzyme
LSGLNFFDVNPFLSRNGTFEQIDGQGSVITMDAALQFVEKRAKGSKPFLQVIWFPSPHGPHAELPDPKVSDVELYEGKSAGYYREIQLLDQQLGRLREKLRDLQIHENTLLWYTSDNGGLVVEHSGGREKKGSVYEGGLRVPSIIEWPAKYKPNSIDVPAFACDIYPTLLSITGATVENQPTLDGVDLLPILSGKLNKRPPMGFWHHFTGGQNTHSDRLIKTLMEAQKAGKPSPLPERLLKNVEQFPSHPAGTFTGHSAWNAWPWKLHRIQKGKSARFELYNLESDPMESQDLAAQESERVESMRNELDAWQNSVLESLNGKDY